jgi:hypothetical protein
VYHFIVCIEKFTHINNATVRLPFLKAFVIGIKLVSSTLLRHGQTDTNKNRQSELCSGTKEVNLATPHCSGTVSGFWCDMGENHGADGDIFHDG